MPRLMTSEELCSRSLRMVGEFPTSESAPDGDQLREALWWLDMIYATTAGIKEVFHLQPAAVVMELTPGQNNYDLKTLMGVGWPRDGISFPTGAEMVFPDNSRFPMTIVSKKTFDSIGTPIQTGVPNLIYIDRMPTAQRLLTWPTLAANVTQTFKIALSFQRQSPDLSPAGVTGARPNDKLAEMGLRASWQEWMVLALAIALGQGPINKQPEIMLARWEKRAASLRVELDNFENQAHDTEPPILAGYAIQDYVDEARLIDRYDDYGIPAGRSRWFLG